MAEIDSIKQRFEIVGSNPQLLRSLETAAKVAPTDLTVLILGESGVGKENISKIIHSLSRRKHNGFIAINCGALPEGTIDSELFGHEKGSFTSAVETRKGYFETVDGGTIFLDEIGEMPLETQSRLLRVLESGEFLKVGSSKVQKTDVRVIAATNKDLEEEAEKGKFRKDLYYRLSTVIIRLPALRERKEDIPLLFAKFASDVADRYHVPPLELSTGAMNRLMEYSFPGNIRQLRNLVEQISILETDRFLNADELAAYLPEERKMGLVLKGDGSGSSYSDFSERDLLYQFLYDIKRDVGELRHIVYELIRQNLQGNQPQPAEDTDGYGPSRRLLSQFAQTLAEKEDISGPAVKPVLKKEPEPQEILMEAPEIQVAEEEPKSLQEVEREMIVQALQRNDGKRKAAAQELGISERTLYRKIKEYNLED